MIRFQGYCCKSGIAILRVTWNYAYSLLGSALENDFWTPHPPTLSMLYMTTYFSWKIVLLLHRKTNEKFPKVPEPLLRRQINSLQYIHSLHHLPYFLHCHHHHIPHYFLHSHHFLQYYHFLPYHHILPVLRYWHIQLLLHYCQNLQIV